MPEAVQRAVFAHEGVAALLEDGLIAELRRPTPGELGIGALYKGRVTYVDASLDAAFVDVGAAKPAYLAADEAPGKGPLRKRLKQGDELIVQVKRPGFGEKAAQLTAKPSLSGTRCVLLPMESGIGISKKITGDDERARLRAMFPGAGFAGILNEGFPNDGAPACGLLLRTAARGASREELAQELQSLRQTWLAITKKAHAMPSPTPLTEAPDALDALANDYADALRIPPDAHLLQAALRDAAARRVSLPTGGRLTFDATEALTAIDVDSGAASGKPMSGGTGGFAPLSLRVNLEAAQQIARQLRMRETGGLIVIDFLHMPKREDQEAVASALRHAMMRDAAPHTLGGFTRMGLFELSRKRRS